MDNGNSTVRDEQFDKDNGNLAENKEEKINEASDTAKEGNTENIMDNDDKVEKTPEETPETREGNGENTEDSQAENPAEPLAGVKSGEGPDLSKTTEQEEEPEDEGTTSPNIEQSPEQVETAEAVPEPTVQKEGEEENPKQPAATSEETAPIETREEEAQKEKPDYAALDKNTLVSELEKLLAADPIGQIGDDVETIKISFYRKHKAEIEEKRQQFLLEGGKIEDFTPTEDPNELKLKELLNKFRDQRADHHRRLEDEKNENLEKKYSVIEQIKDLVNRKESINKTFHDFRDLQQQWRDIGLVPQQNVKSLWESYHLACEMFYDYIKINKELRDLDLKKNLEAKINLCERAEKLLLDPSVINAFKTLQLLHERWREIGPVPLDMKTEIWERFKEITSKINKKHHQYFENLKENQKQNLAEKEALCEKVEEINLQEPKTAKEWEEKSLEIIEAQKIWKTIGFTPKKDNNNIYARFREACDTFFIRKRGFFAVNKEEQKNNLQLKTDLCVQAEALKESTDWKNTTEQLINMQKMWKKIGPVPKKFSDAVWERFRSACDVFFERKSNFFANIDSTYEENLKKKQELIEKIEKYTLGDDVDKNFENINIFQKEWAEIGYVPLKDKEEIQSRYKTAINNLFDQLKIDDEDKNAMKFNTKLSDIMTKPNAYKKIKLEREKLLNKLSTLENDIVIWENNIGFFSNSKNANSLIKDVETKIKNGKNSIALIQTKLRTLDEFCDENNIR
jgi:hypothetical protein